MARASTVTLLPLDRFAKIIGMHPLHFNQITVADIAPAVTCGMPVLQYSWQSSDRIGREEIANCIDEAERSLAEHLGFDVAPRWQVDERINFNVPANPELFNTTGLNIRGMWQSLRSLRGYIISAGQKVNTLIEAARPIVYTDSDSDTYFETATVTVTTTVTDSEEIPIYYPSELGNDEWEIRPTTISISGGVAK